MVSSFTPNKGFDKPANGDYVDTWNIPVNADWDIADKAFGGTYSVSLTNVNVTLTQANCQNVRILLTGNLSGNVDIRFPSGVSGFFVVTNATTGAFTVTLQSLGGGSSVITTQGLTCFVFTDGTNVFFADDTRGSVVAGTGISVTGIGTQTISLQTPVSIANGGTGVTSFPSGNVVIGNGSSPLQVVAPGVVGNVLTSTGTSWVSAAPSGGGGGSGILSIGFQGALGSGLIFTPSSVTTSGQTVVLSGTLAMGFGGTGTTSISSGFVTSNGSSLTSQSKIALASDVSGILPLGNGGTGQISFASGFITSNGVALSSQSKVSLTADVSGTLPWGNGGTGQTSFTSGFVKSNGTALSGGNKVDLSTTVDVTGTLPFGNGGTNSTTIAAGLVRSTGSALNGAATVALGTEVSGQLPLANGGTGTTLVNVSGFLKGPGVGGTAVGASATVNLSSEVSSFLSVANGGTGAQTFTAGYLKANGTAAFSTVSGIPAGDITSGILSATYGGTGANLSAATAGYVKISSGVMSSVASINLATDVGSSQLPVGNGGTGATTATGTGSGAANVLSIGPAFTGTASFVNLTASGTFSGATSVSAGAFSTGSATTATVRINTTSVLSSAETVSVVAPSLTDGVVVKTTTNTQFAYIAQNSTGTENFTVTGDGGIASKGISSGNIVFKTGSNNRFSNDSNWAAEFRTEIYPSTIYVENPSTTGNFIGWYYNNGSSITNIANIVCNGTSVSYNTTSDYRLKNSVENYSDGLTKINALRPVTFSWNATPDKPRSTGFIAHEVQAVIPEAVNGEKDAVDENGNIKPQGIDNSFIVPHLVAAIQELTKRVQELEAKASVG